jgi:hypothetical protein
LSEPKGKMTHPDAEVLAEFRAGLVTGRRGARISAHLAGCERCAGLCDQLAEISALLVAVPVPAMPDAVAQRLEGVLAAEAAQRDSSERAVDPRPPERARSPRPRRRWNFRLVTLRVLAPAAAVAVLAAGGYGLSRIGASSTSSEAASSGSTASSAAGSAALPEASTAEPSSAATSHSGAVPAFEAPLSFQVVRSRTDYQRAKLAQELERELALYARGAAGPQEPASASVKGCVLRVTGGPRQGAVKLVEKAHFEGQPAIVIVAVRGQRDEAWVTTADCSATSDHILATTTFPGTSAP